MTKSRIIELLNPIIPSRIKRLTHNKLRIIAKHKNIGKFKGLLKGIVVLSGNTATPTIDYAAQFEQVVAKIKFNDNAKFIYPLDSWLIREIPPRTTALVSMTVDFGNVLDSNLKDLFRIIGDDSKSVFARSEIMVINSLIKLGYRINKYYRNSTNQELKTLSKLFPEILYRRPCTFIEAIQKLLFYNALFWQMNHAHIGLGRLDKILYPYYKADIDEGRISYDRAKKLLIDFCETLHLDYRYKSAGLIGDTGQYILLGGIDENGCNVENDITHIFLEIFAKHPMTDPKLILRVNDTTSDIIWSSAIRSILKGSGSPLLMNESIIMSGMIEFGYDKADVVSLGTSACWEPLIIGKSCDQNNPFRSISTLKPITQILSSGKNYETFSEFLIDYDTFLTNNIQSEIPTTVHFDCSPLFSLFFDNCLERKRDFAHGGAKYAYHGVQVLGLPNAVNSLINIKKYVFDDKILSFEKLKEVLLTNFDGNEDIRLLFLNGDNKFGKCSPDVINIANHLMTISSQAVNRLKCNGQKLKVGFSSPSYISLGRFEGASADGRKAGEPLAVHISPISCDIDIAEILKFASKMDYSGNRLNGNVVDFIVPTSYQNFPEKLTSIIKKACSNGLFEIQLNVLDYDTLTDAKVHPERHPDLIVRVWGFSAYFNDLPGEYQDMLISRAKMYEN